MDSGGGGAYPDSVDSSPRSRGGESWDEPFPSPSKLRVMCSYGGRIVPRPTDKSLCYLGGETRMVSIERHSSLPDLAARLSRTLLGGRPFTLKYQLPNEDLDSLISVTADEDLDNLIDEYDRLAASGPKSQRIRLFLFPCKSESAPSSITTINSLLDDSKSETWFVDALNGALIEGVLPRGLSADAASVNTLLGLEDDSSVHSRGGGAAAPENGDLRLPRPESSGKIPDSPMLDTTSSFGSASSVPYLPPIRVRPDDRSQIAGVEEQFGNMNVAGGGVVATAGQEMLKEMGFAPQNPAPVSAAVVNPIVSPTGREFLYDDDKSDQGGVKKMLPVPVSSQQQQKVTPVDSPIGDPVTRPIYYQDKPAANIAAAAAVVAPPAVTTVTTPPAVTTAAAPPADTTGATATDHTTGVTATDPSYRGYLLPEQVQFQQQQYHQQQQQQYHQQQQQQQQQQYTHYIHPATGTVLPVRSMPSYYQMPHAMQQPHPYDQQIPMYYMQMRPNQPYNIAPMQPNLVDATAVAAAASTATMRPNQPYNLAPMQPNLVDATIVAAAASTATTIPAKQAAAHLKAPARTELPANPANLYRVAAPTAPGLAASGQQLIHVTPDQAQAYAGMGYQIMHHPHPQYPPQSATPMGNYGYEYAAADQSHQPQMYYTQATSPPTMAAQYQALSSAGAAVTDAGLAPQPQLQTR